MDNEILKICMEKGFLLDKEMLKIFSELKGDEAKRVIDGMGGLGISERIITKTVFSKNIEKIKNVLIEGKSRILMEKFFINLGYEKRELTEPIPERKVDVKLISAPNITPKKISVDDFVKHFRARYEQIKSILMMRGLDNLTSIRKISEKGNYTIIASIFEKRITKNKNLMFIAEDLTGEARILINNNKKEVFEKAKNLLLDDIVAFSVSGDSEWLYANDIIFPDAVLNEKKKSDKDEWVAFVSDFHVGSSMFLEKNLLKFIRWINGAEGDEKQKQIACKTKYLIINGDLVDGVGHFPGQEKWLTLPDINKQYDRLIEILNSIRKDVKIIVGPGNHDAVWVGEPQPVIGEKWAEGFYNMENVILIPNPCLVEINGFKILIYHGASMHGMINEIEELRVKYKTDFPTRAVKEILKRRHLAPMHGSVDYIPNEKKDYLVIETVPDIMTTADLHRSEITNYNNILLIATSCWQSKTPFQEKVGNNPDYCKVPLFNMKTREIKILDFFDEDEH